jgi:hypothetical protein
MSAVEEGEAVLVARKVRGHPVENHTDAALMEMIHQIHEVLRCAVARSRREVAGNLITPRAVERVLHHGHELHVREAHFDDVVAELMRHLAVRERAVVLVWHAAPGAKVYFVDRHRRIERVSGGAMAHPVGVAPFIGQVPHDGGRSRRRLAKVGVGVALLHRVAAVARLNVVLVQRAVLNARDETRPDSGRIRPRCQGMRVGAPPVEVAHDGDPLGVRRPNGKVSARTPCSAGARARSNSFDRLGRDRVGTELFICAKMRAFTE